MKCIFNLDIDAPVPVSEKKSPSLDWGCRIEEDIGYLSSIAGYYAGILRKKAIQNVCFLLNSRNWKMNSV